METETYTAPRVRGEAPTTERPLHVIAEQIVADWRSHGRINFAAVPYLDAMRMMGSIDEGYGCDTGTSIVAYFLANATSWKGDIARSVKAELRAMLKRRGY
jgi:hypothetical protein